MRIFFVFVFIFSLQTFSASANALPDFVALYQKVNPAVVNISTTSRPKFRSGRYDDPLQDMLERFYGAPNGGRPQQGLGSGFIIDKDGTIVTNNHVVEGADDIQVQLDGKEKKSYKARVLGRDARTDIALIKIDVNFPLPTLSLGSSENLKIGEWVAAFGNPLGFDHTITKGIISGKAREVEELGIYPFIQTDASINPGNSGGPLVNLKGEVIGVNTWIVQGAQGLGFAVPIDGVKLIIPDLKNKGKVSRAYLGISFAPIDIRAIRALNLSSSDGVLIVNIEENSPADKAGLQIYDVIVKIGNSEIKTTSSIQNAVAKLPLGSKQTIEIIREGKRKTLSVLLESAPENLQAAQIPRNKEKTETQADKLNLGIEIGDLTKDLANDLGVEFEKRPVILSVRAGSIAQLAGLAPGDIIIDINRKNVQSAKEASSALKKGSNSIRILRRGFTIAVFIEAP